MHNLLFYAHTLWLNYVAVTYILISFSGTNNNLLCFLHGHGKKSEQIHRIKSFAKLHNHRPLFSIYFDAALFKSMLY